MNFTPTRQRKNPEARAAALAWAKNVTQDEIDQFANTNIPNEDPTTLETQVNTGVLEQSIGALLTEARKSRGLGKRELARQLGTNHARVTQLEKAQNLELQSILGVLDKLEFDLSIQFVSRHDGKAFGAVIPMRKTVL
jgi:ribosome-binding protein aMBF1 (putative translation factor)